MTWKEKVMKIKDGHADESCWVVAENDEAESHETTRSKTGLDVIKMSSTKHLLVVGVCLDDSTHAV